MKKILTALFTAGVLMFNQAAFAEGLVTWYIVSDNSSTEEQSTYLYTDIQETDWFYLHVENLTNRNGISGYPDKTFRPQNDISNAEFVKMVVALLNGEQSTGTEHWADGYMSKAEELGLVTLGEYETAAYDEPMKRQDMAKVVSRAMEKVLGEEKVSDTNSYIARITDWENTCNVCKPDVAEAYAKGIITGMPDDSFQGLRTATRAEATTMIVRLIDSAYRTEYYNDIAFNAKTDVNENGIMDIDTAEGFMMYVVENMEFFKENGKYYVKASYPELPDGFELFMRITSEFSNGEPICSYTTHPLHSDDIRKIPNTGSFIKEIAGMTTINDIFKLQVNIYVIKDTGSINNFENLQEGHLYFVTTLPNELGVVYSDGYKRTKYIEYDFTKIFTW